MSLSKRSKTYLLILVLLVIGGYSTYKYVYKSHKTIDELSVKFSGTSVNFLEKVRLDATVWQDGVVELTGTITSKDEKGITLNNSIYCQLQKTTSITNLKESQSITVKGRMIGYDDLLEEIKLDQTIIK